MRYISRPLPRDLPDDLVVQALDLAMAANPDPAYLVETLPAALRQVTGRDFEVMDRSARDVTGIHMRRSVMIRDGDVGHWPGYDSRRYSLLAGPAEAAAARAALAEPPARMPGWDPPGPPAPPSDPVDPAADAPPADDAAPEHP
jgi:hypothetical protein